MLVRVAWNEDTHRPTDSSTHLLLVLRKLESLRVFPAKYQTLIQITNPIRLVVSELVRSRAVDDDLESICSAQRQEKNIINIQ